MGTSQGKRFKPPPLFTSTAKQPPGAPEGLAGAGGWLGASPRQSSAVQQAVPSRQVGDTRSQRARERLKLPQRPPGALGRARGRWDMGLKANPLTVLGGFGAPLLPGTARAQLQRQASSDPA